MAYIFTFILFTIKIIPNALLLSGLSVRLLRERTPGPQLNKNIEAVRGYRL